MLLTVSLKLETSFEDKKKLLKTMFVFNSACDYISAYAFANQIFNKVDLHHAVYYDVRKRFKLSSQFTVRAIAKVCDTYKTDKKVQHKFRKTSSVPYDEKLLSFNKLDSLSLLTVSGRLRKVLFSYGSYANLPEKVISKSALLIRRNKEFYLQVLVEVPEAPLQKSDEFLGVDLGIVNLATTSLGEVYTGKKVDEVRERMTSLRGRLQAVGTKSAKRHLVKISKKERNFKRNTNHIISNLLVLTAQRHHLSIALEELSGFRKTVNKKQRDRFGKWAFAELQAFIVYKAKLLGIEVVFINPRDTSRTCNICFFCDKRNRKDQDFKCLQCGYVNHADINAAINIAARASVNRLIVAA
jgi:IS605 OrfB family transposase